MTTRRNLTSVPHTSTSLGEAPAAADIDKTPAAADIDPTGPTGIANTPQSLAAAAAGTPQVQEPARPRLPTIQEHAANGVLTNEHAANRVPTNERAANGVPTNRPGATVAQDPTTEAPRTYPTGATALRKRPEVPPTRGALALQYEADEEVPPRPTLRLVPAGPEVPDVREWATRLVQAIAETIGGDRPVSQLTRWTDTAVYVDVHRRVRLLGLTTTAGKRATKERSAVRSVHICRPEAGIAEVAAHLRTSGRSRAMALRLEIRRGRWVCTALELG
jgi:hypothetical protein